jgi:DNA-binding NarL/FixJ family response regulator
MSQPPPASPLTSPPVLVLVCDMFFASKISAVARATGRPIMMIRSPQKLAGQTAKRLIVDLHLPGAILAAAEWRQATGGEVVGFASHTDEQTIRQARQAGIDQVMARSRFVQVLPELLA